ncbi:MAG: Ig domain-containing protein [Pseudomonadota bacterium]|nr:Ig domain-containing protein [Pseudomonadota bacterium]
MTNSLHRWIRIAGLLLSSAFIAACGGGSGDGDGGGGTPPPPNLAITTTTLQAAVIGTAYSQTIAATGGTGARTFSVTTGALPAGLTLTAGTGAIAGTPTGPAGTVNFTMTVVDSGTPQQNDTQALSIEISATAVGRNDSIATATTLTNGSFAASISPSGDPSTVFDPDEDFYRITTTAASTVTIDINAQSIGSPMDSVIGIVDAGGVTLNTCVDPDFNSPCVDDDEDPGVVLDSFLQVQVTGATTFYVHVVDWRGDARPDHLYTIAVSGIN